MAFAILLSLCAPNMVFAVSAEESNFTKQLKLAKIIAESKGIIRDMGQDYVSIGGSPETGISIIHYLGSASRTKYEVITPIVDIESDIIYIDCSYTIGFNGLDGITSIGGICRGKSVATKDFLENESELALSMRYSSSAKWLKNVRKVVECKSPSGLVYSDIYFVRCQKGEYDGLTENVTIIAFSPDFNKLFTLHGYEFIPIKPIKNAKKLMFFGLKKGSHYEIVQINLPVENGTTSYIPEKVLYTFSNDSGNTKIAPSFSCSGKLNITEKTICDSNELSRYDRIVSKTYKAVLDSDADSKDTLEMKRFTELQKKWISERNKCKDDTQCIASSMRDRVNKLRKFADSSDWKTDFPEDF